MEISQPEGRVTMKLSVSFDYGAKIFLALERNAILDPPISKKNEDAFASAIYEYVKPFDPHTDQERQCFESRWSEIHDLETRFVEEERKIAENDLKLFEKATKKYNDNESSFKRPPIRKRRIHRSDNPHISRISIRCHYAAILFTALSKIPVEEVMSPETESLYAFSIFEIFNFMKHLVDRKYGIGLRDWGRILDTRIEHGYNAASSLHARRFAVCKQCSKIKNRDIWPMILREGTNGSGEWYCSECGGTETLKRKMAVTNIKKREGKVAAEIDRLVTYYPVYRQLAAMFSASVKQDQSREELKSEFARLEKESRELSFHTPFGYFIQHYDPSKKGRRRICYISKNNIVKIGVTDLAYNRDIQLLAYILRKNPDKIPSKCLGGVNRCIQRLSKLGFPEEYATDKFQTDVEQQLTLAWLASYTSK